jgi:hypothetical protein
MNAGAASYAGAETVNVERLLPGAVGNAEQNLLSAVNAPSWCSGVR